MILIDTSIWIDHLRAPVAVLQRELADGRVVQHPHVTVELALGSLKNRTQFLRLLALLPQAKTIVDEGLLAFVEERKLMSRGIRYVDCQLLASCCAGRHCLWTRDRRLHEAAKDIGVAFESD